MSFKQTSSPHMRKANKTSQIMTKVAWACVPGIIAQYYYFGFGVFIQLALCISVAILTEACCLRLRQQRIRKTLADNSALLTGILLGICLPSLAPWWISVIGTLFAIAVVKHIYGGLGQNIFNPAMAGYVILLISFPVSMTSWLPPLELVNYDLSIVDCISMIFTGYTQEGFSINQLRSDIDGITMATPLDAIKTGIVSGYTYTEIKQGVIFSDGLGKGWFAINIAYLLGGLYLLKSKVIKWQIPISFLLAFGLFSLIAHLIAPDSTGSPLLHLTSGATCFAAFFILTDPVSAATTDKGRIFYAVLIAFILICIRILGGYPDAVAFAVLLANMTVPLIDYYTQPRVYGQRDPKGN